MRRLLVAEQNLEFQIWAAMRCTRTPSSARLGDRFDTRFYVGDHRVMQGCGAKTLIQKGYWWATF